MDYKNSRHIKKLREAVHFARQKLIPFREKRKYVIRQIVGTNYSDDGAERRVAVNFAELQASILHRQLAAQSPRVLVTTDKRALKPESAALELELNLQLERMKFGKRMARCVLNAIISVGFMKVGLSGDPETDDTELLAQPIDLDDWVHDSAARTWDEIAFCGDQRRVLLSDVVADKSLPETYRNQVAAESSQFQTLDDMGVENVSGIAGEEPAGGDEYQPYVNFWDLWIPDERLVVTLDGTDNTEVLRVVEWNGPERGPYHMLGMGEAPHAVMPVSPLMVMMDLHEIGNRIFRKLARQAETQKRNIVYRGSAADDAERFQRSVDNEYIKTEDPGGVAIHNFPGADPSNLAFFLQIKGMYTWFAGNLDALGGLSPQSATLGQDEMLQANASKRVASYQARTIEFARDVVRDLAFYLLDDPSLNAELSRPIPVVEDMSVALRLQAAKLKGEFLDYNFDIDPYSMQHDSPADKLQTITNTIHNVILPLLPYSIEAGGPVNLQALIDLVAKYRNTPELKGILSFPPSVGPVTEQMGQSTKPPSTQRTVTRVNRPGATRGGQDEIMSRVLSGIGMQPDEMAALSRGVA